MQHNLKEENGWLGFINTSILRTTKVNRIINYKKECAFIDMYPTREHYSFVPYFNEERKRLEKNWEYCLTYPFENVYDNYVVHEEDESGNTVANGLLCDLDVDFSTGFYVNGNNAIKKLKEKLDYIGLNNREANEFIMYWLPILESNKHSLVYFELTDERESNNKLIINPKPDSILRINMHIKKIYDIMSIEDQKLEKFERTGFTVVEWAGTIHKED